MCSQLPPAAGVFPTHALKMQLRKSVGPATRIAEGSLARATGVAPRQAQRDLCLGSGVAWGGEGVAYNIVPGEAKWEASRATST